MQRPGRYSHKTTQIPADTAVSNHGEVRQEAIGTPDFPRWYLVSDM